ncbi:efflux RND transporter permease subunit [Sphingobium sp. CFD-1]|uniref:efflux RND transporter permease subunit n=1 Tax=Sphingobium sp. CFD-1 TaxID=2878545 RepID=UPI00214D055D|nr:efflux RND transporter permease subunit [Sphingobium sp. CFD-1]
MSIKVSAWAIRNPIPVVLVMIALTIAGFGAYAVLPIKQTPNIEFPLVVISVTQNGAAPAEIETQITRPIEDSLSGISGLRHISSTVVLGASTTTAEFEIGADMQKSVDDVRTAVEKTRAILPAGIDPPSTRRIDVANAPILTYAVNSPKMSDVELSWFVDDTIARAIQAQPGVAQVSRVGGVAREINVTLDPQRLTAYGVTASAVNRALALYNRDDPGGRADIGRREQVIRVLGSAATVEELRGMMIPVSAGRYVRLDDIATVADGTAEQRSFARLDGRPAVAFQVSRTANASEVSVEDEVDKAIAKLMADHPEVKITTIVSTVKQTRMSYVATVHVLIEGMILAALVVLLFLRNWRATVITALAMPLSLIPTFAVMKVMGFSLNIITLLALTLVIGILVDDAIVEIENIEKRIERGESPYRASLIGADMIGLAVIATTATIVVVFLPVSFMSSQVGQFFREFGLTVAVAVLFSLLVARFVTPLMAAYFLRPVAHSRPRPPINPLYEKALDWALAHRWRSVILGALAFFGALAIAATMQVGFQPVRDAGFLYLTVEGPRGATTRDMDAAFRKATTLLQARPEVTRVFAQTGVASSSLLQAGPSDVSTGTITVLLDPDRSMTTEQFTRSIAPMLRSIPDARITAQSEFGRAGIEVVLTGDDSVALEAAQLRLWREMRTLPTLIEPRPSPPPASPELVIRPKADAAALLNVSSAAIAETVRVATIGDIDANVPKFSAGRQRLPIRVRLPEDARADLETLANLRVPTINGGVTALSNVADLSFEAGPGEIRRYDRERRVSVQADMNGVTLGTALRDIHTLPFFKNIPAGVHETPTGDTEALGELFTGIIVAMASGIALIYAVMVLLFRSFFKPVTILSALPLTMLGAFLALKIAGLAITLPVLIGMLMLLGLAAKNSILLVEFAIEAERAGQSQRDAIVEACRERMRPIVMTTVAMAAGMLPTALGIGEGSDFRQPMAVAVIGGLISSTILSLLLVPTVYEILDDIEMRLRPRLARLLTPKAPGDDAPIPES